MGYNATIIEVGERHWLDANGEGASPDVTGAKEFIRVTVELGAGHGKRVPTTNRVQLQVPAPYSQAAVIQAVKTLVATLPDKHPDEGLTLGVV